MNDLEDRMVKLLREMKERYAVVELKAEFEAEASRIHEVMRLKEIADKADLGIMIKIGGPEAITDMFEAQHIGVSGIVAPMVESAYALEKFLLAVEKHFLPDDRKRIVYGANIETYQACKNIKKILGIKQIKLLNKITVGRVDLVGSMNLKRTDINTEKIYKIVRQVFIAAKGKKMLTALGGGIDEEAVLYIKKLASDCLLDYFETRKVVFAVGSDFLKVKEGIIMANQFELLWLENKKAYYSKIYSEDDKRIEMLKKRVK